MSQSTSCSCFIDILSFVLRRSFQVVAVNEATDAPIDLLRHRLEGRYLLGHLHDELSVWKPASRLHDAHDGRFNGGPTSFHCGFWLDRCFPGFCVLYEQIGVCRLLLDAMAMGRGKRVGGRVVMVVVVGFMIE